MILQFIPVLFAVLCCSISLGQTRYRAELTSIPGILTVAGAPRGQDVVSLFDGGGTLAVEFELSEDNSSFASLLLEGKFAPSFQATRDTLYTADVSILHEIDGSQSARPVERLPDGRLKAAFFLNRRGATSSTRAEFRGELLDEHLDQTMLRPGFRLPVWLELENGVVSTIQLELGVGAYLKRNSQPDEGLRATAFNLGSPFTTPPAPVSVVSNVPEADSVAISFTVVLLVAILGKTRNNRRS